MKKNVLITGGAGFIGSNLALKLIEKDYNITILDTLSRQIHGDNPHQNSFLFNKIKNKVNFIEGSITIKDDIIKAISNIDIIIHFAAETGTGQSMYQIEKYVDVNIRGTALLLDILANTKNNVKKIIVASSRSIYGEGKYFSEELGFVYPNNRITENLDKGDFEVKYPGCSKLTLIGTDENSLIHPSSVYGITKQNQEQMIMTVCPTLGISSVALRYQNVYGPGQSLTNPYTGILSIFSTLIKNEQDINIFEDGKESRDFVYIDDVVDATILSIENPIANYNVYNVGSGIPTSVLEVATELKNNFNSNVSINITGNYRLGDIRHNYADLNKINTELGFVPKFSFKQGLYNFTKWVDTQVIIKSKYEDSIIEMKNKGLLK